MLPRLMMMVAVAGLLSELALARPLADGEHEVLEERGRERGSWEERQEKPKQSKPRDKEWERRVRERERERELAWQEIAEEKNQKAMSSSSTTQQPVAAPQNATTVHIQPVSAWRATATPYLLADITPSNSASSTASSTSPTPNASPSSSSSSASSSASPSFSPSASTTAPPSSSNSPPSNPSTASPSDPASPSAQHLQSIQHGERPREDVRGQAPTHDLAMSPVLQAAVELGQLGPLRLERWHGEDRVRRLRTGGRR